MKNKIIVTILAVIMALTCLTGCKKQEPVPTKESYDDPMFKSMCSPLGQEFFDAFKERSITEMAKTAQEDLRAGYIEEAERFYSETQNSIWIEAFYNAYLNQIQVVEGAFTRIDDSTGQIEYKLIIANYDSDQNGSIVSYNVSLQFVYVEDDDEVYISNPAVSLELYDNMVDEYAWYLLDLIYPAEPTEPDPTPTPEPTPVPTPVPLPEPTEETATQPEETQTEG